MINPRVQQTALLNKNYGPAPTYGIANVNGAQSVKMGRIEPGDRSSINTWAQNAQNMLGRGGSITPRGTGIYQPINTLTAQSYAPTAAKYGVAVPQALTSAIASKNPQQIAQAHYDYSQSLPKLGQNFGSFALKFAPSLLAGPIGAAYGPLAGAAFGAAAGGITGGVKGALLGGIGGYGLGNFAKLAGVSAGAGSNLLTRIIENPLTKAASTARDFKNATKRG